MTFSLEVFRSELVKYGTLVYCILNINTTSEYLEFSIDSSNVDYTDPWHIIDMLKLHALPHFTAISSLRVDNTRIMGCLLKTIKL
jgi:hypothetical protein